MTFVPPPNEVVKSWEGVTKGIYRLLKAAQQRGAQSAAMMRTPQTWGGNSNGTPPGSGGSGGQAWEEWLWLLDADQSAGTPWVVTDSELTVGILRGLAVALPQFGGIEVFVGPHNLPQSDDGSESYPCWVWDSTTGITIYNLSAYTSAGGFAGDLVRIRALI